MNFFKKLGNTILSKGEEVFHQDLKIPTISEITTGGAFDTFKDLTVEVPQTLQAVESVLKESVPEILHEGAAVLESVPGLIQTGDDLLQALITTADDLVGVLPALIKDLDAIIKMIASGATHITFFMSEHEWVLPTGVVLLLIGWFMKGNYLFMRSSRLL